MPNHVVGFTQGCKVKFFWEALWEGFLTSKLLTKHNELDWRILGDKKQQQQQQQCLSLSVVAVQEFHYHQLYHLYYVGMGTKTILKQCLHRLVAELHDSFVNYWFQDTHEALNLLKVTESAQIKEGFHLVLAYVEQQAPRFKKNTFKYINFYQ